MLIVAGLVTALGVGHVARRQQVIRLSYQLTDAVTELRRLEEEDRRLRLERSVLTNPARIERLALAMGMTPPGSGQVRVVSVGPAELAAADVSGPARIKASAPGDAVARPAR